MFGENAQARMLEQMIFFGEASLRRAIDEFIEHYHRERPHQGLDNSVIELDVETLNIEVS